MKVALLLSSSLALAGPAWAEEPDARQITVVASGHRLALDQSGQSVSIAARDEIDAVQGADLTRLLERLPGVSINRNGGLGGQTGLNVRGGNSDQVLVLVDGVRIADYVSPGGGYDLGNMLPGTLDKVELLRGSNSFVWGSQAMAGVLALSTREVNGAELSAEYGAYDTVYATGTAGIRGERGAASLSGGFARTDGFSATPAGPEKDGYRQWQVSGKARAELAEGLVIRAAGRHADSRLELDLTSPDSAIDLQETRESTARAGLDYEIGGTTLSGGAAWSGVRRHYEGGFGPSTFTGSSRRLDLSGRQDLGHALRIDFGADADWTRARSTFDPRSHARSLSGHALIGRYAADWSLAAGVRIDDHSRFGTHATLGASGTVSLGSGWRLRASYGEGFKAPTLYQLFGGYVGNSALKPERSRSFDAGIELADRNAPYYAALTLFRRDSRNLIDLDSSFVYANVARARAQGAEFELGATLGRTLRTRLAYTWLKARDRTLDRPLARRPRHAVSLSADWSTPLAGLMLGADLRFSSDAVEYDFSGSPTRLDGFALATLRASVPLGQRIELFGRLENVTDTHYETAAGFNTPGRSAYLGARARF